MLRSWPSSIGEGSRSMQRLPQACPSDSKLSVRAVCGPVWQPPIIMGFSILSKD